MKHILSIIIIFTICFYANAQNTTVIKSKPLPATTTQKPVTLQQGEKNIPVPKLPDLRIKSINVKMFNSQSADSSKRFLEISYTIKNDGIVSIALNTIFMEGVIINNGGQPGSYPGCGTVATTLSGVTLKAGEEYSGSYRCYSNAGVAQCKSYTLSIDSQNIIKEIAENNNSATTSILFQ